ncbi:MAG: CNNM domain-containing protein [Pirellulaceae bacterium]|jgi:CBS domain containing-hemolysin-like protein|nr:CNNM domain-containing protein [Pirellulaceae bacterium]
MIVGAILFALGIFLSAFFSGSETGFYRVTRVRLLLDGLGGDPIARTLLWLTYQPTLFVATALIGNNLANYLVSLSIVILTQYAFEGSMFWLDLLAPVALSPLIFVYGELLPKSLFYRAPNLLLRRTGPLFFLFALAFAPLSALLWAFGRVLQALVGEAPLRVRLTLARGELQQVLAEGEEVGILRPAQRQLAQGLFSVASHPVIELSRPVARLASVELGAAASEVLRIARRHRAAIVPVADKQQKLIGYVRIVDLCLSRAETVSEFHPLVNIPATETLIAALIRMQSSKEELAAVVNDEEKTIGLLYAEDLTSRLFRAR